jgi:hypothetical protein
VSAEEVHALLVDTGSRVLESGDVGLGNLRFAVAARAAGAEDARA